MLPDALASAGFEPLALLSFMVCVAVASYAQNLTGFAFSLILLGLVSVLHIATIADTANAAMLLTLVNAWTYFRTPGAVAPWALVRPALAGSTVGVVCGVALLAWLGSSSLALLRALLGLCVLGCAVLLVVRGTSHPSAVRASHFAGIGALAGLLGGLFAASGPPLVYYLYRQPLDRELVRRALLLLFSFGAAVRLLLVLPSGQFTWRAATMAACAVPVVYGVTRWHHRIRPRMSVEAMQRLVATLLGLTGGLLLLDAWRAVH